MNLVASHPISPEAPATGISSAIASPVAVMSTDEPNAYPKDALTMVTMPDNVRAHGKIEYIINLKKKNTTLSNILPMIFPQVLAPLRVFSEQMESSDRQENALKQEDSAFIPIVSDRNLL